MKGRDEDVFVCVPLYGFLSEISRTSRLARWSLAELCLGTVGNRKMGAIVRPFGLSEVHRQSLLNSRSPPGHTWCATRHFLSLLGSQLSLNTAPRETHSLTRSTHPRAKHLRRCARSLVLVLRVPFCMRTHGSADAWRQ